MVLGLGSYVVQKGRKAPQRRGWPLKTTNPQGDRLYAPLHRGSTARIQWGKGRSVHAPSGRGWPSATTAGQFSGKTHPVGTGIIPYGRSERTPNTPRDNGDGPSMHHSAMLNPGHAPQAREPLGMTSRDINHHDRRVSPAGAGMVLGPRRPPFLIPRTPRRRGDGPQRSGSCATARALPSTPRRRGDGPISATDTRHALWYAPQARGWSPSGLIFLEVDDVRPAGAGMVPVNFSSRSSYGRTPRRRGDGPSSRRPALFDTKYAPQARGSSEQRPCPDYAVAVRPAGAGMVPEW